MQDKFPGLKKRVVFSVIGWDAWSRTSPQVVLPSLGLTWWDSTCGSVCFRRAVTRMEWTHEDSWPFSFWACMMGWQWPNSIAINLYFWIVSECQIMRKWLLVTGTKYNTSNWVCQGESFALGPQHQSQLPHLSLAIAGWLWIGVAFTWLLACSFGMVTWSSSGWHFQTDFFCCLALGHQTRSAKWRLVQDIVLKSSYPSTRSDIQQGNLGCDP